jgi:glycosyltransferase involved in cell wall biosynthesis
VITTDKVNIWREIAQAGAGEIIHCDSDELRNAMIKLLDHPDLRKQYGVNGRLLVETKYRWDIVTRQLVQEY